jgi:hypothetical protein
MAHKSILFRLFNEVSEFHSFVFQDFVPDPRVQKRVMVYTTCENGDLRLKLVSSFWDKCMTLRAVEPSTKCFTY